MCNINRNKVGSPKKSCENGTYIMGATVSPFLLRTNCGMLDTKQTLLIESFSGAGRNYQSLKLKINCSDIWNLYWNK